MEELTWVSLFIFCSCFLQKLLLVRVLKIYTLKMLCHLGEITIEESKTWFDDLSQ